MPPTRKANWTMHKRFFIVVATVALVVGATTLVNASDNTPPPDRAAELLNEAGARSEDRRPALTTQGGQGISVIPKTDGRCVVEGDYERLNCQDEAAIARGYGIGFLMCAPDMLAGTMRLSGLAPAGMSSVKVVAGGRGIAQSTVSNGAFSVDVPVTTADDSPEIEFAGKAGTKRFRAPVPPDIAEVECAGPEGR